MERPGTLESAGKPFYQQGESFITEDVPVFHSIIGFVGSLHWLACAD